MEEACLQEGWWQGLRAAAHCSPRLCCKHYRRQALALATRHQTNHVERATPQENYHCGQCSSPLGVGTPARAHLPWDTHQWALPQLLKWSVHSNSANDGLNSLRRPLQNTQPFQLVNSTRTLTSAPGQRRASKQRSLAFVPDWSHVETICAPATLSFSVGSKINHKQHQQMPKIPEHARILRVTSPRNALAG